MYKRQYSTQAAMTVSISDMTVPPQKPQMIADAQDTVDKITRQYKRGPVSYTHLDVYKRQPLGIKTENVVVDFAEGDMIVVIGGVWKDTVGVITAMTVSYTHLDVYKRQALRYV